MKYANRPHPFPIPTILLALLIYLPLVCGVNLADIFRVKGGQIAGGLDNHKDVAQLWLDDTVTLLDFVLANMPEDGPKVDGADGALRRNLKSWFNLRLSKNGIHKDDIDGYSDLHTILTQLDQFLKQKNPDFLNEKMPWIFYNSDWQVKTELLYDDQGNAIDVDGDTIMDPEDPGNKPQANMRTWNRPPSFKTGDEDRDAMLLDMKKGSAPDDWDIYTYWSSDILDYGVSKKSEEAKVGNGGFCDLTNGNDMFALTIGNMLVDSVTLCPDAFTEKAELHETIAMGMASDEATSKKLGVTLESTSPRSLTLFHELIHLSSGTSNTKDVGTKPTESLALITSSREAEARRNPDSIVFFAWSYYLEKNGDPSFRWHNGKKVRHP